MHVTRTQPELHHFKFGWKFFCPYSKISQIQTPRNMRTISTPSPCCHLHLYKIPGLNILIILQLNAQYVVSASYLVSHWKQMKETCSVGLWEFHVDHGVFIVKQPPSILSDVQLNIRLHVTVGLLVSWSTWCKKCITHITARQAVWKSKTVKKAF